MNVVLSIVVLLVSSIATWFAVGSLFKNTERDFWTPIRLVQSGFGLVAVVVTFYSIGNEWVFDSCMLAIGCCATFIGRAWLYTQRVNQESTDYTVRRDPKLIEAHLKSFHAAQALRRSREVLDTTTDTNHAYRTKCEGEIAAVSHLLA